MPHYDELFRQKMEDFRAGNLSYDDFAAHCEAMIEKYRARAEVILESHTPLFLSFAERSARKQCEGIEAMENGFDLVIAFLNGGEEDLLEEAVPYLHESIEKFKEAIELNEECLELDGGVGGMM